MADRTPSPLMLKASSNRIRKEGKGTSPQRFIPLSGAGTADWVRNGELGSQSPPQQSFLPVQEMRMEQQSFHGQGLK